LTKRSPQEACKGDSSRQGDRADRNPFRHKRRQLPRIDVVKLKPDLRAVEDDGTAIRRPDNRCEGFRIEGEIGWRGEDFNPLAAPGFCVVPP
jgi:hypothetical protein